jgi:chemotaxis protein histidine kinase CheA
MSAERLSEIQSSGSGVGIRGMRERVLQLSGRMSIESDSSGTRIHVAIPTTKTVSRQRMGSDVPVQTAVRQFSANHVSVEGTGFLTPQQTELSKDIMSAPCHRFRGEKLWRDRINRAECASNTIPGSGMNVSMRSRRS